MDRRTNLTHLIRLLIVLVAVVAYSSAYATASNQADLKDTKVEMSIKEGTIIEIMNEISSNTEYLFIYEDGIKADLKKQIKIEHGENLHDLLTEISKKSNLEFRAVNKNIVVRRRAEDQSISNGGILQAIQVSGRVTSGEDGSDLPGVNIVEKGTTNGTVSDIEGNFTLQVPGAESVLVFSSVGFNSEEITVGSQTVINLALMPDITALEEIVVTALGIERETKSLGYSVGEVEGDELTKVAQENVLNSLAGRVSGVTINSTGTTGSSVSMVIRGATSLTSDNQPLFVIDGIPMNNSLNNITEIGRDNKADYGNAISDLNPEDIENISVLKGPSAAALYGSRAGNGVVLITTKSGKKGKGLGVTITSNTVMDMPYKYLEKHNLFANGKRPYTQNEFPANGQDYYMVPAADSYWVGPELDKGNMAITWPYATDANGNFIPTELVSHPDNAKNFFETGYTTTNGVSLVDATDKLNYRLSYSNMQHKGNIPNSDLNKNSIGLNSTLKLNSKLSVDAMINFTTTGAKNRPANNRGTNPMQALYDLNSHIDVRDLRNYWIEGQEGIQQYAPYTIEYDDGEYVRGDQANNPYFLAYEINNGFKRNRIYGSLSLNYNITDDLMLRGRYNHDQFDEIRESKGARSYTGDANGIYGILNLNRVERNADILLSYNKKISNWDISASAGANYMYQTGSNVMNKTKSRGSGLITPGVYNLGNIAPDNLDYSSYLYEKAIYSVYGLASIGFRNFAYLDITARNDWSSTLPEENRSYFYPSASLSLVLNNMVDMGSNISLAKLRGGWAQVGNDTDPYKLLPTMSNLGSWDNQIRLGMPSTVLLPNLKPEIQTSYEFGFDFAMFNDRLRMDATWYRSENENQILNVSLPPSSGYSSRQINAGLISSQGIEASIGGSPVVAGNFRWDVNFVYSKNRAKVEELAEGFDYITLWTDAKGGAVTWVGEEIGQIIDRALVRVEDPNSPYYGWPIIDDEGWEDSNSQWSDEDGNRVAPVIGNFNPDFMLGFQTSLSYKRWTLNANFDWRKGGQFVSQTFRYGESDLHTERWLNKTVKVPLEDAPQFFKDNADKYLSPDGEFFVIAGGPTSEYGGYPHTEGGISLNDGVFMPGVVGDYDENGNFVAEYENLGGPETQFIRYQDYYGWSYTRNATFDADFVKLREISLTYDFPVSNINWLQAASLSVYSRNIILWTAAGINIDPETAFQPESSNQKDSSVMFKQGIERYNVSPWVFPLGFKLNLSF